MAIKLLNETIEPLTRELVDQFYNMPQWDGQRPKKQSHIRALDAALQDGRFHSPRWSTGILNGIERVADGQHSCHMLHHANGHFPNELRVIISRYQCDTEKDLADLFSRFDSTISVRTKTDNARAAMCVHPDLRKCNAETISFLLSAVVSGSCGVGQKVRIDPLDHAQIVHSHHEFVIWAYPLMGGKHRLLRRVSVASAVFRTWLKAVDEATAFWRAVIEDDHPDKSHPTRVLHEFLLEAAMSMREPSRRLKRWTDQAIHVKCIHAWNAFRKGTRTDLKYYANSETPEPV